MTTYTSLLRDIADQLIEEQDLKERAGARQEWMPLLREGLPEEGRGLECVLETIEKAIVPHSMHLGATGFCGWVTTMTTAAPAVAQFVSNFAAAQKWWVHPGNFLEAQALRWLAELLGLPVEVGGGFVGGGSEANLIALAAARQHAGERVDIDVALEGVHRLPMPRVYTGGNGHRSVIRAAGVLGLGRNSCVSVPFLDLDRKPDLRQLRATIEEDIANGATPVAVVACAGDVNMGTVAPIDDLLALTEELNLWLHIDGAYGGFGVLDDRVKPLYGDLSKVDSFCVDPHKWLAVPVGCGAVMVRDSELLERAMRTGPVQYLRLATSAVDPTPLDSAFDEFGEGSQNHLIAHSAPSRGLMVWAALNELGRVGITERVGRHLDCARRVASRVRDNTKLELLSEPVLSICCFRYLPGPRSDEAEIDSTNEAILKRVRGRGRVLPSATEVDGHYAIRPCFIGPRTTLEDADAVVDEVLAAAEELGV